MRTTLIPLSSTAFQLALIFRLEMFSFFRRKTPGVQELTFKHRVENFWRWYVEVAPRFYQTIEDKKAPTLAEEMNQNIDKLLSGFAWVFGPGANGKGHSLTLSGEGVIHKQLLADYWLASAPAIDGWTFYSSRQPSTHLKDWALEIEGNRFESKEFWLTPSLDYEREQIDITAWHPLFSKLEKRAQMMALFLLLDEALGELGTQNWIGEINVGDGRLTDSISLLELPTFVQDLGTKEGWKKFAPSDTWTGYQMKEPHIRYRRGDTIAGTTNNMRLIEEFLNSKDALEDPLADTGADFVFIQFDRSILPDGEQVDARGKIEEALEGALSPAKSGRHLGGALGTKFAYIDLLLFDGASSLDLVQKVLREQKLPKGTSIEFFADKKRGHRIVI